MSKSRRRRPNREAGAAHRKLTETLLETRAGLLELVMESGFGARGQPLQITMTFLFAGDSDKNRY